MASNFHILPLDPPFDEDVFQPLNTKTNDAPSANKAAISKQALELLLPASYREEYEIVKVPTGDLSGYLQADLGVERLNRIDSCLWFAGRPMPPRPLNYQIAICRNIVVDEKMDMHLVWEKTRIMHFKPIPRYLLNYNFWKDHLCCSEGLGRCREQNGCPRRELYKCALGFLLSYAALIQYESDFQIAQHRHLLPTEISWEIWVKFIEQVLARKNFKNINPRYRFGELRLSRLNKIYAIRLGYILRGYRFPYQTYTELFQDYLAPIAAATVYIAVVLTAMQVGLATDNLGGNRSFQNASYGFTVFSILAPLILLGLVTFIWFLELVSNIYVTWKFKKKRFRQLEELVDGG